MQIILWSCRAIFLFPLLQINQILDQSDFRSFDPGLDLSFQSANTLLLFLFFCFLRFLFLLFFFLAFFTISQLEILYLIFALRALAKYYNVSVDYLIGLSDNEEEILTPIETLHLSDEAIHLLKGNQRGKSVGSHSKRKGRGKNKRL